jgi:hypothetical protein
MGTAPATNAAAAFARLADDPKVLDRVAERLLARVLGELILEEQTSAGHRQPPRALRRNDRNDHGTDTTLPGPHFRAAAGTG